MSNKLEPLFGSGKRSAMECSKALATLGFNAWNDLEPGEINEIPFSIIFKNVVEFLLFCVAKSGTAGN